MRECLIYSSGGSASANDFKINAYLSGDGTIGGINEQQLMISVNMEEKLHEGIEAGGTVVLEVTGRIEYCLGAIITFV